MTAMWRCGSCQRIRSLKKLGRTPNQNLGTTSQLFLQTSALNCSEGDSDPQGQRHGTSDIAPLFSLTSIVSQQQRHCECINTDEDLNISVSFSIKYTHTNISIGLTISKIQGIKVVTNILKCLYLWNSYQQGFRQSRFVLAVGCSLILLSSSNCKTTLKMHLQ